MGLIGARAGLVGRLRDAAYRGKRAVDQPHDLADEDPFRRPGEAVAPELSALARHDPRLLEGMEDLLQELDRKLLAFSKFRHLHQLALHLRGNPQVDEGAQSIFSFLRERHKSSAPRASRNLLTH